MNKRILGIVLLALVVRIAWVIYSPALPYQDFSSYQLLAERVAQGLGYSGSAGVTAFRPPGYPLSLALAYFVFGSSVVVGQMVNVVLGVVAVYVTYLLGKHLFTESVGLIAALLVALTPSIILYTAIIATENLATPLLLISILCVLYAFEGKGWGYIIPAGMALGLAILARPGFILYPAVFLGYALINKFPITKTFRYMLFLGGVIVATMSPWILRNFAVFNEFVPVSTNGGFNLAIAFNDISTGEYVGGITEVTLGKSFDWEAYRVMDSDLTEPEADKLLRKAAIEYIQTHPKESIRLAFLKFRYFVQDDVSAIYENTVNASRPTPDWLWLGLKVWAQFYYMASILLAMLGLVVYRRLYPQARVAVLVLSIVYWIMLHTVFHALDRFHIPILPLVMVLGSVGIIWTKERLVGQRVVNLL